MNDPPRRPVFRFAPSPNGRLHLGHAYSALLNAQMAARTDGRFLLRIEDTDVTRCRPEFEAAIVDDLAWLGLVFPQTPRRQSEHIDDYARALASMEARGLVYPCFCTRSQIERMSGGLRDPDGAPLHRGACRAVPAAEGRAALRLDMARAASLLRKSLTWREYGEGAQETLVEADPAAWGDVILRGKETPANYHMAVVVDDSVQGVSDVVRGRDLYHATSIHRLLQELLGLEAPLYRHHRLVRDASGAKMSKGAQSKPLSALRERGVAAETVRDALGFGDSQAISLGVTIS
jgi:glutamyl-Q tRNA(Asp) synthetase